MNSNKQIPVILVHGFLDKSHIFKKMAAFLRSQGFVVYDTLDLKPSTGKNGLEELAKQLENYINEKVGKEKPFHLIGFSMGGIVSRYYLQKMEGYLYVKKLITLASPHHGSILAWLLNIKSCQELRPNSAFLNDLNTDIDKLKNIEFTSIWAKYDTMILPNKSSNVKCNQEIALPFGIHSLLPSNKKVIQIVSNILNN